MKLVVGLGNPGKKYEGTRHNVGFVLVDKLVTNLRVAGYELDEDWTESKKGELSFRWARKGSERIELVKPQTFMNVSGLAVAHVRNKHRELADREIFVVHDDLDIQLGDYKIQFAKGPKDHGGLLSIYENLGTKQFWHVRVGVDNRELTGEKRTSGEEYVLQPFTNDEMGTAEDASAKAAQELAVLLQESK